MLKTRFDQDVYVVDSTCEFCHIEDVDTIELLQILGDIYRNPTEAIYQAIFDIQNMTFSAWEDVPNRASIVYDSIHNFTSMSLSEILQYVSASPYALKIIAVLEESGVNVANYLHVVLKEELRWLEIMQANHKVDTETIS